MNNPARIINETINGRDDNSSNCKSICVLTDNNKRDGNTNIELNRSCARANDVSHVITDAVLRKQSAPAIYQTAPSRNCQQGQEKESFREFLARRKKHNSIMAEQENVMEEFVKDDYAKSASCNKLIRKATGVIYDDRMMYHECQWDYDFPESPRRYSAVLERCMALGLMDRCICLPYSNATVDQITSVHTKQLYHKLQQISVKTDSATQEKDASDYDAIYFGKETFNTSVLSAGCAVSLVKAVCDGTVQNGMAIIRPPGHHAMNDEFCGYCYFNNVAIAASYVLNNNMAKKILIVDFDIHHGQATQRMFYDDNRVLYFSIHRYEYGTFWPNLRESDYDNIGKGKGLGFNINFPLNTIGLEDKDYLSIIHHILLPVAYEFQPEIIIFSAGFDSCMGDEKGEMNLTPGFYGHLITSLSGLARGKLAVCLEGGYFLPSLAEGVAMTLKALLGDPPATLQPLLPPHDTVVETINNIRIALHDYWNCFGVFPFHTTGGDLYRATIKYEKIVLAPPFPTRNWYPVQTKENITKYIREIRALQKPYFDLGINQLVSCCYDDIMLGHSSTNDKHAETPNRLVATYLQYKEWGLDERCANLIPRVVDINIIKRIHNELYVNNILQKQFESLILRNKGDMFFNNSTLTAILAAVGCLLAVVDDVLQGKSKSGVALIRPPGHHADKNRPSGFCYLNNIAIAAQFALDNHKLKKILIIDFDIHHGNGTQSIFYNDNRVLYISIHRFDNGRFFPCSQEGNFDRCGEGEGEGFNINIPINHERLSNIDYITIFNRIILPIVYSYVPDVILVSAGFDAGIHDNLGNYLVTPDCFGHFIQLLKPLANGKLILALEGGYNPTTVKYGLNICIKTLLGDPLPILDLTPNKISENCFNILENIISTQKKYWPALSVDKKLVAGIYDQSLPEQLLKLDVSS